MTLSKSLLVAFVCIAGVVQVEAKNTLLLTAVGHVEGDWSGWKEPVFNGDSFSIKIAFDGATPDSAPEPNAYWNSTAGARWQLTLGKNISETFSGPALVTAGNFFPSFDMTGVITAQNLDVISGASGSWASHTIRLEWIYGLFLPHSASMDVESLLKAVYHGDGALYRDVRWGNMGNADPHLPNSFMGTIDSLSVARIAPVPEPSTYGLGGLLLIAAVVARRRAVRLKSF